MPYRIAPPPVILFALLAVPALGCDNPIKGDSGDILDLTCNPTSLASAVSDTSLSTAGFYCRADFTLDALCDENVYGVIVTGSSATPAQVKITPPAACGASGYTDSSPDSGWDTIAGAVSFCGDVDNNTAALTCNSGTQARSGPWSVYLPLTGTSDCSWPNLALEFLQVSGPHCDPPADTPHDICADADDAPAVFVHRGVFELDGDDSVHSHIIPVLEADTDHYTERAWLRNVSVTTNHATVEREGRFHDAIGADTVEAAQYDFVTSVIEHMVVGDAVHTSASFDSEARTMVVNVPWARGPGRAGQLVHEAAHVFTEFEHIECEVETMNCRACDQGRVGPAGFSTAALAILQAEYRTSPARLDLGGYAAEQLGCINEFSENGALLPQWREARSLVFEDDV